MLDLIGNRRKITGGAAAHDRAVEGIPVRPGAGTDWIDDAVFRPEGRGWQLEECRERSTSARPECDGAPDLAPYPALTATLPTDRPGAS